MSASAVLDEIVLAVQPGDTTTTEIRVKNTGSIVEEFSVAVVGEAEPWAVVEPAIVSLLPEATAAVTITITPPRDHRVVAGPRIVAVKVEPRENPDGVVVEEFQLDVGAFSDLGGELVPRTVRARRWASTRLAIDNRGNSPTEVHLRAQDADEVLRYEMAPQVILVGPGGATFATLRVRAKNRPFKGPPVSVGFTVRGEPDFGDVVHMDGAVQVIPVIPQWAPRLFFALVIALLALVALWFGVVKPTLESTAREAVARDVAAAEEAAALADESAGTAGEAAVGAEGAAETVQGAAEAAAAEDAAVAAEEAAAAGGEGAGADGAGGDEAAAEETAAAAAAAAAGGVGGAGLQGVRPSIVGDPFSFRLQVVGPPGSTRETTFTADENDILSLTDIVLQNPQGDRGILRVGRSDLVLLETRLENFRDLDYHFLAPIVYTSDNDVVLSVTCENDPGVNCSASAYFAGYLFVPPAPTPPPIPEP